MHLLTGFLAPVSFAGVGDWCLNCDTADGEGDCNDMRAAIAFLLGFAAVAGFGVGVVGTPTAGVAGGGASAAAFDLANAGGGFRTITRGGASPSVELTSATVAASFVALCLYLMVDWSTCLDAALFRINSANFIARCVVPGEPSKAPGVLAMLDVGVELNAFKLLLEAVACLLVPALLLLRWRWALSASKGLVASGAPAVEGRDVGVVVVFERGTAFGLLRAVGDGDESKGDCIFSRKRRTPLPSLHGATSISYPLFLFAAAALVRVAVNAAGAGCAGGAGGAGGAERFFATGGGGGGAREDV